jgi:hypothetical protein
MADDLGTIEVSASRLPSNPASDALGQSQTLLNDALSEREDAYSTVKELAQTDPAKAAGLEASAETGIDPKQAFNVPEPTEHFQDIMKQAPWLMALAAIGSSFGRARGLDMLQSTNAMMKGIVQGSDAAYSQAREKYDQQYKEFREQSKTWFDVYKTYMTAYKGRVDVAQKAAAAADRAVGVAGALVARSTHELNQLPVVAAKLADTNSKISKRTHDEARDDIRLKQGQERLEDQKKRTAIAEQALEERVKHADVQTLTAESRSINEQIKALRAKYPASKGDMPDDVKVQYDSLVKQLGTVAQRIDDHTQANFQQNESLYKQAREALAAGADRTKVVERLVQAGLDPGKL